MTVTSMNLPMVSIPVQLMHLYPAPMENLIVHVTPDSVAMEIPVSTSTNVQLENTIVMLMHLVLMLSVPLHANVIPDTKAMI